MRAFVQEERLARRDAMSVNLVALKVVREGLLDVEEQVVESATHHNPAWVSVAGQVTAESCDSVTVHGVGRRSAWRMGSITSRNVRCGERFVFAARV